MYSFTSAQGTTVKCRASIGGSSLLGGACTWEHLFNGFYFSSCRACSCRIMEALIHLEFEFPVFISIVKSWINTGNSSPGFTLYYRNYPARQ